MLEIQRPLIAGIVYRIISGNTPRGVFSFADGRYYAYTGVANKQSVYIHDEERDCYLTGYCNFSDKLSGGNPVHFHMHNSIPARFCRYTLYDYGAGFYISLDVSLNSFSGYDYKTRCYFGGNISGNYISFYDYQTARFYNYAASMVAPKQQPASVKSDRIPSEESAVKGINKPVRKSPVKTGELPPPPEKEPDAQVVPRTAGEIEKAIEQDIENLSKTIESVKDNKKAIKEMKKVLKEKKKEEKKLEKLKKKEEKQNKPN